MKKQMVNSFNNARYNNLRNQEPRKQTIYDLNLFCNQYLGNSSSLDIKKLKICDSYMMAYTGSYLPITNFYNTCYCII